MLKRFLAILLPTFLVMTAAHAAPDDLLIESADRHIAAAQQQSSPLPGQIPDAVVPNAEVAKAIHLAVAGAVYGEAKLAGQRPFQAVRRGDFWVVSGSLPPKTLGGTAVTVMRASTGEVLRVTHER